MMNTRLHPHDLLFPGIAFGVLMVLLSFTLVMVTGERVNLNDWYPADAAAQEILLGLALGTLGTGAAWIITSNVAAFIALRERLTQMMAFESLTVWHAAAFGLMAGFPEEMLFRGAIQPKLGVFLSALIFGSLHAISRVYFLYATLAGVLLGLLAEWRGDLWAATTAHLIYDMLIFLLLAWYVQNRPEKTLSPDEIAYR